jgi:hypothetical protein
LGSGELLRGTSVLGLVTVVRLARPGLRRDPSVRSYTLPCPELAAPFLGIWYLLGMLIPTAFGAWLGPRVLRW